MSLATPYKSKNAAFDSVEEVIMVRGMTPAILYGAGGSPGIFDFLTVYSGMNTINVNAAAGEVLAALPGMNPDAADMLITSRTTAEIKGIQEMTNVTGVDPALMAPYISFSKSGTYTIEAAGYKKGARQSFTATATVTIQGDTYKYVYYKSPAGTRRPKR
jgi:general secretion pathway protein K